MKPIEKTRLFAHDVHEVTMGRKPFVNITHENLPLAVAGGLEIIGDKAIRKLPQEKKYSVRWKATKQTILETDCLECAKGRAEGYSRTIPERGVVLVEVIDNSDGGSIYDA